MAFTVRHKSYYLAMGAWAGDVEPLARFIEEGGELGDDARKFLANHLRGAIKRRRGNPRIAADEERRTKAIIEIRAIQILKNCSEYAAVSIYLNTHKNANRDTVKSWLRRDRNRVQK